MENATTEGVVRLPSALTMTVGSPPSMTATQEFVVPKSMPIILLIKKTSYKIKAMVVIVYIKLFSGYRTPPEGGRPPFQGVSRRLSNRAGRTGSEPV